MATEQTQVPTQQPRRQSLSHQKMSDASSTTNPKQNNDQEMTKENQPYNTVVMQLQRQVANAYLLYTNYKHYHWNTYGPLFRDLHLLFDEFAMAVLKTSDEFAERIRMIGQDPLFSPAEILESGSIKAADRTNHTMQE